MFRLWWSDRLDTPTGAANAVTDSVGQRISPSERVSNGKCNTNARADRVARWFGRIARAAVVHDLFRDDRNAGGDYERARRQSLVHREQRVDR